MSDACGVMNWKSSREFWKLSTVAVFIASPAAPGKVAQRHARFALPDRTIWKFYIDDGVSYCWYARRAVAGERVDPIDLPGAAGLVVVGGASWAVHVVGQDVVWVRCVAKWSGSGHIGRVCSVFFGSARIIYKGSAAAGATNRCRVELELLPLDGVLVVC